MNRQKLVELLLHKRSFLCVGLDSDIEKLPAHLRSETDPQFAFNREIFDATCAVTPVYKINIAFYESLGVKGWQSLQRIVEYIRNSGEDCFLIADAKRGDIGNTSKQYARAFFDKQFSGLDFDAVTVAPYMGSDSVIPFLEYKDKWSILLALTSNQGAYDFQFLKTDEREKCLFEQVIFKSKEWGDSSNMMYVVGATKAQMLRQIREIIPDHFLLIPGVGAQGGSLEEVVEFGMNQEVGILVNASRSVLFASSGTDFAAKASIEAASLQKQMEISLKKNNLI